MEKQPLYLSVKDSLQHVSVRERAVNLRIMMLDASDGGIGIARLITEPLHSQIRGLLRHGQTFLRHVLTDVQHYRVGTNVWDVDDKVYYDPADVFQIFATLDEAHPDSIGNLDQVANNMEDLANQLLAETTQLRDPILDSTPADLSAVLKRYNTVSIPYIRMSSDA